MATLSLLSRLKRRVFPQAEAPSLWGKVGWYPDYSGGSRKTKSGERVDHNAAMTLPTYWACLTGIAADIAKVPAAAVRSLEPRGRETLYDHPATRMLDGDANPNCAGFTFRETLTGWALGWGNGYAEIVRDGRGNPLMMWPIHPSRVVVKCEKDVVTYWVRAEDVGAKQDWIKIPAADMFHLRGYGDGVEGVSVLKNAAESLGLALAGQSFASSFFGNDLSATTLVTLKVPLADDKFDAYKAKLVSAYTGSAGKAHGILVSNGEADFKRMSVAPDEAQVLESRGFSVPEICRWFRRSPQKVGHSDKAQGWGTLDALQVADTTDCLMPWWIRWEKEAKRKLIAPTDRRVNLKHFVQALMRGEPKTRAEVYQTRIQNGTLTPNEVRELEDELPIDEEGADSLWMQGAMQPIEILVKGPPEPTPPAPGGESRNDTPQDDTSTIDTPDSPPPAPEPKESEAVAQVLTVTPPSVWLRPLFDVAASRIVSKECLSVGKRANKAADLAPWAAEFYAKQRSWVAEEFRPIVTAMSCAHSGPAHEALSVLAAGLWPDPVARTAEAFRVPEMDLAFTLASLVFDTCCAALVRKEAA